MIWIDIVIFALIAFFFGSRLLSVLGERHGQERQRNNPFERPDTRDTTPQQPQAPNAPPSPNNRPQAIQDSPIPLPTPSKHAPDSLAGRLAAIEQADPNFNEKGFLGGAKKAFTLIITSFAAGDTATLRPLLADDVYESFAEAIRSRLANKEKMETIVNRIKEASIENASLQINTAQVTVRFVSEQIQAVRNEAGDVIGGSLNAVQEITDIWTFSRNTRSSDPNWKLAETRAD